MTDKRLLLIMNPQSGTQRAKGVLKSVLPILSQDGRQVEICETKHPGHARDIAKSKSLDGVARVCLIGGDGTLHEVLNGIMAREDSVCPPLGISQRARETSDDHQDEFVIVLERQRNLIDREPKSS